MIRKRVTLEFFAYAVILLVSLGLRFINLGQPPLNDFEASNALAALDLVKGSQSHLPGQAGYLAFTTGTFFIFNATDFFARFWPALIGSLLVLIPAFFRQQIGRIPALLLAAFFAIDPLLIATSRTAAGGIFGVAGMLAGIGFWQHRRPVLSGIAFALMLAGGVDMWSGLLALLLSIVILRLIPRVFNVGEFAARKPDLRKLVVSAAVTLLLVSTVFLIKPQVIGSLGAGFTDYLLSWTTISLPFSYHSILAWLMTLLPGVVLGVWGIIAGFREKDTYSRFLAMWWTLLLLIAVLNPSRNTLQLFWASIPMWILAAVQLHRLLTTSRVGNRLIFRVEIVVVISLTIFSLLFLVNLVNNPAAEVIAVRNSLLGFLLPLALLAVVTLLFARGWDKTAAWNGMLAGFGLLLLTGLLGSAWKAASLGNRVENEIWTGGGAPVGESLLIKPVSDLSLWSTGWEKEIDIQVTGVDFPSLNWALRDYHKTRFETVYNPTTSPSLVITGSNEEIQSSASYRGQSLIWSSTPDFQKMTILDWGKWALLRKAPQKQLEIILWARNDLFLGNEN